MLPTNVTDSITISTDKPDDFGIFTSDAAFDDFLALDDDWLDDDEAEFIQDEENTGLLQ